MKRGLKYRIKCCLQWKWKVKRSVVILKSYCCCYKRNIDKRVNFGNNKIIDRKKRWGGGSYWYEILWRDYYGLN